MIIRGFVALGLYAAMSLVAFGSAWAAEAPDNVMAEVAEAAKTCRELGGRPNTEAMLRVDDLNGDGGEDWIVDYTKLDCAGETNPFCGSGGCSLSIYFWSGGSTWKQVFDDTVRGYRFRSAGGRRLMEIHYGGGMCGKANAADCLKVFVLQRDRIVPAR